MYIMKNGRKRKEIRREGNEEGGQTQVKGDFKVKRGKVGMNFKDR